MAKTKWRPIDSFRGKGKNQQRKSNAKAMLSPICPQTSRLRDLPEKRASLEIEAG
jgi:hypothetical protein